MAVLGAALTTAVALPIAACTPGTETLPPEGHVVLYLDTDAPLPKPVGVERDPSAPPPLFDRLRIDVLAADAGSPCDGCSRDFPIDDALFDAGASIVIESTHARRLVAHVVLFRAATLVEGATHPEATVEVFAALPAIPAEGAREATVFLPTDEIGRPIGSMEQPIETTPGRPSASRNGTWGGALRKACGGAALPGEVCIPGGAFWMGNPLVIGQGDNPADRLRLVVLSPFYLDADELTVAKLRASGVASTLDVIPWSGEAVGDKTGDFCTYTPDIGPHETMPVDCISWEDARAYCRSRGADLPTEAQLEYVGGALESRLFVWGTDEPGCGDAVWGRGGGGKLTTYNGTCRPPESIGGPLPLDAGSRDRDRLVIPGAAGGELHDLMGNLSEWTVDRYNGQDEPCWTASPNVFTDPTCDVVSPSIGDLRSVRGGRWLSEPAQLRAAWRDALPAGENAILEAGVRCARAASR